MGFLILTKYEKKHYKMVYSGLLVPKWYLKCILFYTATGTIMSINSSKHFIVSSNSRFLA